MVEGLDAGSAGWLTGIVHRNAAQVVIQIVKRLYGFFTEEMCSVKLAVTSAVLPLVSAALYLTMLSAICAN